MKVVKFPEFIKELHENKSLIFSNLHDYSIEGLYEGFRMEGNDHDFILTDLLDSVEYDYKNEEWFDVIDRAVEHGEEFKLALDDTTRDGLFDYDRQFVIYDKGDIKSLVDKLSEYLK